MRHATVYLCLGMQSLSYNFSLDELRTQVVFARRSRGRHGQPQTPVPSLQGKPTPSVGMQS